MAPEALKLSHNLNILEALAKGWSSLHDRAFARHMARRSFGESDAGFPVYEHGFSVTKSANTTAVEDLRNGKPPTFDP